MYVSRYTHAHTHAHTHRFASSCGLLNEKRYLYRPVCTEGQTPGQGCPTREDCRGQCRAEGDWDLKWLERHPCFLSYVDQYTCTVPPNRTIVCWGNDDYRNIQARRPSSCVGLCMLVTYNKYVCMHACMHVCMYRCIDIYI